MGKKQAGKKQAGKKTKSVKKVKIGFFRFKALIPFLVLLTGVTLFFLLFLDPILRNGIVSALTKVNKAKVDLNRFNTSLSKAALLVKGFALTDAKKPDYNLIEFDTLKCRAVPRALLSKKVYIKQVDLLGLQFNTKRQRSGCLPEFADTLE